MIIHAERSSSMTQLQVAYQQLQETKRANEARESISQFEADTSRLEANLKQAKLPYEVRKLINEADVSLATKEKLIQEISNLQEEVRLIQARTDLTKEQKEVESEKAYASRRENWKQDTGFYWIDELISALTGGLGKAVGSLIK